jgi:S-DNA-T family DNA segregation ATPase FtsK/SpoIIIE
VLATQRPAGVIKDSLRANANFRIALRVADEADSKDIIGSARAAHFNVSIPGRAAARCGPNKIVDFQSAYIDDDAYLEKEVENLQKEFALSGAPPPYKAWRDPMDENILFSDFENIPDSNEPLGLADIPERQTQEIFSYNPKDDGNLIVFGSFGTGKSAFIESLIYTKSKNLAQNSFDKKADSFYIISGQASFSNISKLKTVGAFVNVNDEELVDRIMDKVINEIKCREKKLSNTSENGENDKILELETLHLIIDDFQLFRQIYDSGLENELMQKFEQIVCASQSAKVAVILTTDRVNAVPNKIMSYFATHFIMKLVSEQDYLLLGIDKGQFSEKHIPGRGFYNGLETQIFTLSNNVQDKAIKIDKLLDLQIKSGIKAADGIFRLPKIIDSNSLIATLKKKEKNCLLGKLLLGLEYTSIRPLFIEQKGLIVVSGPPKSGKSNLMDFLQFQIPDAKFIRNIHSLTDEEQEKAIFDIQDSKRKGKLVVVEILQCNNPDLWKIVSVLKNADVSICIQPDNRFSQSFSYLSIPKCKAENFPPGRGYVLYEGKAEIIQTPLFEKAVFDKSDAKADSKVYFQPSDEVYSHHQQQLQVYSQN